MNEDEMDAPPKLSMDLFSDLGLDIDQPYTTFSQQQSAKPPPPPAPKTKGAISASTNVTQQAQSQRIGTGFQWEGFDQVRDLQDQNTSLLRKVDDQQKELEEMRSFIEDLKRGQQRSEMTSGPVPDAGQKISQLSKKVRELTASLSAEQSRAKKFSDQTQVLENNVATMNDEIDRLKRKEKKLETRITKLVDPTLQESELKEQQLDIAKSSKGEQPEKAETFAFRSQIQTLKKELHMALKALAKEVGEDVPVAHVLSGESSWKGRAEQITFLKLKLAEAQSQTMQDNLSFEGTIKSSITSSSNTKEKNRSEIRKTELERKAAFDRAQEECQLTKQENSQLKQKLDGFKARNQTLSQEIKDVKDKYDDTALRVKEQDEAILALQYELTQLRSRTFSSQDSETKLKDEKAQLEELCSTQHEAISKLKGQVEEIEKQKKSLRKQHEKELESLRDELNAAQFHKSDDEEVTRLQLQNHQLQVQQQQFMAQTQQLQQQLQMLQAAAALPQVRPPSRAPSSSSSSKPPTSSTSARASSATRRDDGLHRDCQIKYQEMSSAFRAADVEKTKQAELIGMYKKQLSEFQAQIESLDAQVRVQKRSCMRLEKDLSTVLLKNPEFPDAKKLHDLEARLALLDDENQALKESTRATMKRKDDEIVLMNGMLGEIKRVYSESLKSLKQMMLAASGAPINEKESPGGSVRFTPRPPSLSRPK